MRGDIRCRTTTARPESVAPAVGANSLRRLLKEGPDLPRGVEVAVGAAEQAWAVCGGVGHGMAAALDLDELDTVLARGAPASAYDSGAVARVGGGGVVGRRRGAGRRGGGE